MGIISTRGILRSRNSSRKTMSKLKTLLDLTLARLAILKNQRKARCNHARGDLLQIVQLAHQERALLRAEVVIREQNMLDVFAMIEGYCHLLKERTVLLEQRQECPYELREAVSSLVFASSRLGDLPELQHASYIFTSMFGKEFVIAAKEIRNGCQLNPMMVQKLSTKQPSLESRVRVTKEIAAEKGITLDLVYDEPNDIGIPDANAKVDPARNHNRTDSSARATYKYKDAVSAAKAAYESAEDAAAAAKAAVELSRSTHVFSSGFADAPSREAEDTLENSSLEDGFDERSESEASDVGLACKQERKSVQKTRENFLSSSSDLEGDAMGSLGSIKSDDLSATHSLESTSFESEHEDSENILPKVTRKGLSVRTRR